MTDTPRYLVTRVKKDPNAPKRYQRSGWIVFDTKHHRPNHLIFKTRREAEQHAETLATFDRTHPHTYDRE